MNSENSYKEKIDGTLTYTITQSINQMNFLYSNSNTKSLPFSIAKDETEIPLSFGSSDSPATLSINLKFSYTQEKKDWEININELKIHFVADDSEKNNQQNKMSSSSQKKESESKENTQSPKQNPSSQQNLQNSQLSQDSSALKKQLEKDAQDSEQLKQQFSRKP
jgi:hypothetical protein